jgi:autotransporter-associated beta strand protein
MGAGGAAFVRAGGSLTLIDPVFAGTVSATGGASGGGQATAGQGIGQGLFLGGTTTLTVSAGNTLTLGGSDFVGGRGTQPASADPTNDAVGPLFKAGTGTLVLGGPNSYAGGTAVTAGTLRAANPTGSATGPGAVTVASGGMLAGGTGGGSASPFADSTQGFLAGPVTVQSGGAVAPGAGGPGLLTVTGSVTFQTGSAFAVDLATKNARVGAAPADVNTYDRVKTAADILFGAGLEVDVNGGGQAFTPGGTYDFFIGRDAGTVGGLPASVTIVPTNFASPVSPNDFVLSRSADLHSLILTFTPVPEPGSLLLAAAAAVAALVRRRAQSRA